MLLTKCILLSPNLRLTKKGCINLCIAHLCMTCNTCSTLKQILNEEEPTFPKGVNLILDKEFDKLKSQHTFSSHPAKRRHFSGYNPHLNKTKNAKYPFKTMEVGEIWKGPASSTNKIRVSLNRLKTLTNKFFTTKKEDSTLFVTRTA